MFKNKIESISINTGILDGLRNIPTSPPIKQYEGMCTAGFPGFINSGVAQEMPEDNREYVDVFGTHWLRSEGWIIPTGKIDYEIKCNAPSPCFSNQLYWKYV
jgi:hypothetical protein